MAAVLEALKATGAYSSSASETLRRQRIYWQRVTCWRKIGVIYGKALSLKNISTLGEYYSLFSRQALAAVQPSWTMRWCGLKSNPVLVSMGRQFLP